MKSQTAPGSDYAIFSEDAYQKKKVKTLWLVHRCPSRRRPLAPAILLSPLPRSTTCLHTAHLCPHCPLHEGLPYPDPRPPPSPTRASRPCSGHTFSPNFAFTRLLKIWSAFSSVFPWQSATFPFIALIFYHQCVCVWRLLENRNHTSFTLRVSGWLHGKCLIYEMHWV